MPVGDEPRPGSFKVIAMAAASAFAISAIVFAVFRGLAPPRRRPFRRSPRVHRATPSPREELELVDLVVRVTPSSAQIAIDGAAVSTNPFQRGTARTGRFTTSQLRPRVTTRRSRTSFSRETSRSNVSLERLQLPPLAKPPRPLRHHPRSVHPAKHVAAPQASESPAGAPATATDCNARGEPDRRPSSTPSDRDHEPLWDTMNENANDSSSSGIVVGIITLLVTALFASSAGADDGAAVRDERSTFSAASRSTARPTIGRRSSNSSARTRLPRTSPSSTTSARRSTNSRTTRAR